MPPAVEPSYSDLVYAVLQESDQPLTFAEIFDGVSQRRPITTKNPKSTIRGALSAGPQLISLGDGRYGYLPHLINGSVLRLPLIEKKPANHPLLFPDELRQALWPSFFETQKRRQRQPAHLRLSTGVEVTLSIEGPLEGLGNLGEWGSPMPEELRRLLVQNYAAAGDSLLVRVTDADAPRGEIWFEPARKRDRAAVTRRNHELLDAVEQLIRRNYSERVPSWELVIALLARGFYRADIPPDSLESLLKADARFTDTGWSMWMLTETVTPDMAIENERMKIAADALRRPLEDEASSEEQPSMQAMRRAMERSTLDVGALIERQGFESIDDVNAFLQETLLKGAVPHRVAVTPVEKAQDVMYDAWEAPRRDERIRLARLALQISPDCADAYVLLAEETAHGAREALDLYALGVAAGERALGEAAFREDAGHFWGMVETRPYMRARYGLAQALWSTGKRREAIEHAWELLRLNPGDNQGVREALLSWLLERGDSDQVHKLFAMFPDDAMASFLYARALQSFRDEGDSLRSRELLAEALKQNSHVPNYLTGRKHFPRTLPETVGWGDESEAIYAAMAQLTAWHQTHGAIAWLRGHKT